MENYIADSPLLLPLREQHSRLRDGRLSARTVVEAAVDAHQRRGKHDNAYITWNGDGAFANAAAVDCVLTNGGDAGPLMGCAVSVKDNYGVPGFPIYAGASERLPEKWEKAGPVVEVLLSQLPSLMGKTHTVELAFGGLGTNAHWGAPRNPWDEVSQRVPGGSSSGAGVSLVGGTASLALGSDTAGSIRIPASMTGVAGLKLTAGRWSIDQIVPLSPTLDTPGLMAFRVDDLAFAFEAMDAAGSKAGRGKSFELDLADLTFGVPERYFWECCSPGVAEAVETAIRSLESAGARIVKLDLPGAEEVFELFQRGGIAAAELASFLHTENTGLMNRLDRNVALRVEEAQNIPAWEYVHRRQVIDQLSEMAKPYIKKVDAILTPTVAITPPALSDLKDECEYKKSNMLALRNTVVANFLGLCALTMPVGQDRTGMPVGLQVIGGGNEETFLLEVGRAIERELGTGLDILGTPPEPGTRDRLS